MIAEPEEVLKQPYARVLIPNEDNAFSAEILEFPGCIAQGDTPNDAIQNLENAAVSWIEAALGQGQDIPTPSANYGYTGKIALRLPRSIHKKAIQLAHRDGTSLNQFLLGAIAARVGAEDFYGKLLERLEEHRKQTATWGPTTVQFQTINLVSAAQVHAATGGDPAIGFQKLGVSISRVTAWGALCVANTAPPDSRLLFFSQSVKTDPE